PTHEVLAAKRAVLVYFCDRWCPPLSGLMESYEGHEEADVEIVFVSSDEYQSAADYDEQCSSMPWAALLGDGAAAAGLMSRFACTGVPFLAVLDGSDG
ncbi:unnamed protein product, partial [Polarella glacialis]